MRLFLLSVFLFSCATVPPAQRAQKALTHAQELREKNQLRLAFEAYTEALDAEPTNLLALRGYVEVGHITGHTAEVIARFRDDVSSRQSDPFAHEGLGLAFFAAGGSAADLAQPELTRAVELAPNIADFQYRLGLLCVESDRFADAIKPLAAAIALDGKNPKYRLPYGLALARTGDRPGAIRELQTVLTLSPSKDEMVMAEKTARSLVDPFRNFPQAAREQWEIALGYLDHDATPQAKQVLDSLMQKYPDIAIVHALSGLASAKDNDASKAIYELRKSIDLDPSLAEPRLYLGDIYNSHGRPDNAREHYEAAIERNPYLADAYKRLAEVHSKARESEAAAGYYKTYLLLKPDDADALIARAKLLGDMQSPDTAAAWDSAVEAYPLRVEILVPRARYYFEAAARAKDPAERKRLKDEAHKSIQKAVDIDPENTTASSILSELERLP